MKIVVRNNIPRYLRIAILAGMLCAPLHAGAQDSDGADRFEVISSRNIFNPTRRPNRPADMEPIETPPPEKRLSLVGAMVADEEPVAFFSGTDAVRNPARPGEQVMGLRVIEIEWGRALLGVDETTRTIALSVGQTLRRIGDNPWEITDAAPVAPSSSASAAPERATSSGDAGGGDQQSLLERLRARREQELRR